MRHSFCVKFSASRPSCSYAVTNGTHRHLGSQSEQNGSARLAESDPQTSATPNVQDAPSLCFRCFNSPKALLAALCFCVFIQSFLVTGIVSVSISTIVRRFQLDNVKGGLFSSMYDIAACLSIIPVCHFGGKGHKGRWLGFGMLIGACGSLICTLPQFLSGPYDYVAKNDTTYCRASLNSTSTSSEHSYPLYELLSREGQGLNQPDTSSEWYVYALLLGQLLHGVGLSSIYTLGVSYLDENVSQRQSPLFMGLFMATCVLGPAFGYMLGGAFLNIWGDIGKSDIPPFDSKDSRWYGAWWLGFLVAAFMAIIAAFPLMMFPKTLPGAVAARRDDVNQMFNSDDAEIANAQLGFGESWAELKLSLKVLFSNWTFVLLVLVDILTALGYTGITAFLPSLIEIFFDKSPSTAALLTGLLGIPAIVLGNIFGGYIVRRFGLKCSGMIIFSLVSMALASCFLPIILIHCPQPEFAGVTDEYENTIAADLWDPCNAGCYCSNTTYDPICYKGRVFYSACFAGCTDFELFENGTKKYSNCACLHGGNPDTNDVCGFSCDLVYAFMPILAVLIGLLFVTSTPVQQAELRCVPFNQRTIALGIRWIFLKVFGMIPSPILFGTLMDGTCEHWKATDDGNPSSCAWYDTDLLSRTILLAGIIVQVFVMVSLFASWKLYRPPPDPKQNLELNFVKF